MRITGLFSEPSLYYQSSESFKDVKAREGLPNPERDSSEREDLPPGGLVDEEFLGLPKEDLVENDLLVVQEGLGKLREELSFSVCPDSSGCQNTSALGMNLVFVIPGCDGSESTLGSVAGLYRI